VIRYRLGSDWEDHVVAGYEGWMEVGLPVLRHKPRKFCDSLAQATADALCQSASLCALYGTVQMLSHVVPW
jgi:hypothetical protein